MDTIGFAIVGPGMVADYHQKAIASLVEEGARLRAVCHYDNRQFETLSRQFGSPCLTLNAALERDDIDALCICTPSGQHAEQTIAAARAGKHVLVEKPMALSMENADAMIEACETAGVQLGVVFQRRALPQFHQVYERIQAGHFGRLTLGALTMPYRRDQAYYDQAAWRGTWEEDGGGALMNQGIHLIDLLVWYMGDPVGVKAYADTLERDIEVEDVLAATLQFADGGLASVTATTTAEPGSPHRLEIYGTRGGVQLHGEQIRSWPSHPGRDGTEGPDEHPDERAGGSAQDPGGIEQTGHTEVMRDFLRAIREQKPPLVDGREGRRSLAAVLAIYEAAGLGAISHLTTP